MYLHRANRCSAVGDGAAIRRNQYAQQDGGIPPLNREDGGIKVP